MKNYLIKNGRVIDPANGIDEVLDILVKKGKIVQIGQIENEEDFEEVDALGKVVTPGLVDMHVHLREPGREDKETIESGLRAALRGGFTSVLAMPNTNPLTDNQSVVEFQLNRAKKLGLANLFVAGRITKNGENLAEMWEMKNSGALAMTNDGHDVDKAGLLKKAFQWSKTFDLPILTHAEEKSLSDAGVMHEGEISLRLGLVGIPRSAEDLAVYKSILLAEEVGARVHISHISTAGAVEAVRMGKGRGVMVTAEATPHHFVLTHEECLDWNTNARMYPPLRERSDVLAVQNGLKDGTIEVIATDHAPHLVSEKLLPFSDAPNGVVGLETAFGVGNSYLVKEGVLSLFDLVEKMSVAPARVLGIEKGTLSIGCEADISIFDLNEKWSVDVSEFESKGRNSAFEDKVLFGRVCDVFVGGVRKVRDGQQFPF